MVWIRLVRSAGWAGLLSCWVLLFSPSPVRAEWYAAAQLGVNFADPLRNVRGSGTLAGLDAPNFNLKTSPAFGGKLGLFPSHGIFGLELDVSHSTPHIKNLDDVPGIHLSVTNIGGHVVLRYPGVTWQPYIGGGPALLVAHLGRSSTTERDTQVSVGGNVLVGIRAFVTPKVAMFTEYKYTDSTFRFGGAFGPVGGFDATYRAHQLFVGLSYHF
ncbi:MAG: porin family protein [Nitrospira sp.]|nr:porin family protein [Nitrospira sp.]MCS6264754.1 porin family protein [Nitrospira sp.]